MEKKKIEITLKKEIYQLISGAGSGAITKSLVAPLERVKILFQVEGMRGLNEYKGIINAFQTVIKEEGFNSLWKGNGAAMVKIIPVYALKFSLNDLIRRLINKNKKNQIEIEKKNKQNKKKR